jgi:hypothetical protein
MKSEKEKLAAKSVTALKAAAKRFQSPPMLKFIQTFKEFLRLEFTHFAEMQFYFVNW